MKGNTSCFGLNKPSPRRKRLPPCPLCGHSPNGGASPEAASSAKTADPFVRAADIPPTGVPRGARGTRALFYLLKTEN